jgi:hypothetical protein
MTSKKSKQDKGSATGTGNKDDKGQVADDPPPLAAPCAWQNGVPATVRNGTNVTVTSTTTEKTNKEKDSDGYTNVTTNNFEDFQAAVVKAINKISLDPAYKDHNFIKTWKAAKINQTHPINETSSFRTVSKVFKLSDLKNYRSFLASCPTLECYINMKDNKPPNAGIVYRIVQDRNEPGKAMGKGNTVPGEALEKQKQ